MIFIDIQTFIKLFQDNSGAIATTAAVISIVSVFVNACWTLRSHYITVRQNKREQAEHVAAWLPGETVVNTQEEYKEIVALENDNHVPMYNVFALSILNNESTNPTIETINSAVTQGSWSFLETLPPGLHHATITVPRNEMGGKLAIPILLFTDSKGISWIRTADGHLEEADYVDILHDAYVTPPYSRVGLND